VAVPCAAGIAGSTSPAQTDASAKIRNLFPPRGKSHMVGTPLPGFAIALVLKFIGNN